MLQTGYKGVTNFSGLLPFNGGFCKWFFTPRENIATMPAIDPTNQWLEDEPVLKEGKAWFGPVTVPDDQLGFEEIAARIKAGTYYKQKVYGFYPGDDSVSRINLENLPYYEMVIIGKLRAGGMWIILGTDQLGLQFDADFKSGPGAIATAGHDMAFTIESPFKGLILPSFDGDNTDDGNGDDGGGDGGGDCQCPNKDEIIVFTAEDTEIPFDWSDVRKAKFGSFPLIEVWVNDTDAEGRHLANVPILVDAFPPDTETFIVQNPTGLAGIIVIK